MNIRINIHYLHHYPGKILKEGDKDYETFKYWAEKESRKMGILIAEFVPEEEKIEATVSEEAEKAKEEEENPAVKLICDICGFESTSENGMKIHKSKAHKE